MFSLQETKTQCLRLAIKGKQTLLLYAPLLAKQKELGRTNVAHIRTESLVDCFANLDQNGCMYIMGSVSSSASFYSGDSLAVFILCHVVVQLM